MKKIIQTIKLRRLKTEVNKKVIVEDVKGMETKEFKIKRKLFEYKYPSLELRIIKMK